MLEVIGGGCFLMLFGLTFLSVFSFGLRIKGQPIWLFIPFVYVVVFAINEVCIRISIPSVSVPIRADLVFTLPMLVIVFASLLCRCLAAKTLSNDKHRDEDGQNEDS